MGICRKPTHLKVTTNQEPTRINPISLGDIPLNPISLEKIHLNPTTLEGTHLKLTTNHKGIRIIWLRDTISPRDTHSLDKAPRTIGREAGSKAGTRVIREAGRQESLVIDHRANTTLAPIVTLTAQKVCPAATNPSLNLRANKHSNAYRSSRACRH